MRQPQTSPTLLTSLGLRVLGAQSLLWLAPRWLCAFEASHHPSDGPWVLSAASWGLSPRGRWETVLSVAGEASAQGHGVAQSPCEAARPRPWLCVLGGPEAWGAAQAQPAPHPPPPPGPGTLASFALFPVAGVCAFSCRAGEPTSPSS